MILEDRPRNTSMRMCWSWALARQRKPPADVALRARQIAVTAALLAELAVIDNIPTLHELYARDGRWAVTVARRLYPRAWMPLNVGVCLTAAFGYRYVELATGVTMDPVEPPVWLVEYAIE